MFQYARWAVLAAALAYLAGCGPNKGEQWADKINEKIVAKIKAGEIKTEVDLAWAKVGAMQEAADELKLTKYTESEKKRFDEKMAAYEAEWKKMLPGEKKS